MDVLWFQLIIHYKRGKNIICANHLQHKLTEQFVVFF